jgi:hypothetical protein
MGESSSLVFVLKLVAAFIFCLHKCDAFWIQPRATTDYNAGCGTAHRRRDGQFNSIKSSFVVLAAKKVAKKSGKKKSPKGGQAAALGFGGAANAPCPCGQGKGYMKCCGVIHNDVKAYTEAAAEQVVRARYSAYSNRIVRKFMSV